MSKLSQKIIFYLLLAFMLTSIFFEWSRKLVFSQETEEQASFAKAKPGYAWQFPRDHGVHPEYQTEWWYFTGHLKDATGHTFGFQWTVFRTALQANQLSKSHKQEKQSPWRVQNLYLGHMAISDLQNKKFYYEESISRDSLAMAGGSKEKFQLWLDDFSGNSNSEAFNLEAKGKKVSLNLTLKVPEHVVLQGQAGYSPKSHETGHGSNYYTYPHMDAQGVIRVDSNFYQVTGKAWMDHEFGSNQLTKNQLGWDWLGLPLQGKQALMIYRLRDGRGVAHDYVSGTYIDAKGLAHSLSGQDIKLKWGSIYRSRKSKAEYPMLWQIKVPKFDMELLVQAQFFDQELITEQSTQVTYWEGSVSVKGRAEEINIDSLGYLEMTGYAEKFDQDI